MQFLTLMISIITWKNSLKYLSLTKCIANKANMMSDLETLCVYGNLSSISLIND